MKLKTVLIFYTGFFFMVFSSHGSNPDRVKAEAILRELDINTIQVKSVGAGKDIMLEGFVSSKELSRKAEEITSQYYSNVFNLISIEEPAFSYQVYSAVFEQLQVSMVGSRYLEVLKQSLELNDPFYFLLFDQKELSDLREELKNMLRSESVDIQSYKTRKENSVFKIKTPLMETSLLLTLETFSLDNGFFKCLFEISALKHDTWTTVYSTDLYCKNGEWICISGFSKMEEMSALKQNKKEIIFMIKPTIREVM